MILDENKSADITVIDSQSAGPGLGLIVVKAAQMAKEGFEKKLIIEKLNSISCLNHGIFLVNKLDHLYRGGRITKTKAFM